MPAEVNNYNHNSAPLVILGSLVGLGVYLPALLLRTHFKKAGVLTEEIMLESLFEPEQKAAIQKTKEAFQKNFRLAQIAYSMPSEQKAEYDTEAMHLLLQDWKKRQVKHFILLTGIWIPVIQLYSQLVENISLDCCHLDATSPSWQKVKIPEHVSSRQINLFDCEKARVNYYIPVDDFKVIDWNQRTNNLTMHGGGWGIGKMKDYVKDISGSGYNTNIIILKASDADFELKQNRYYMINPAWDSLSQAIGHYRFPPMLEVEENGTRPINANCSRHELYYQLAGSKAVISKPGGMTLMDSFTTATPLVFIDSLLHENKNSQLWQEAGFGISFSDWKDSGYSEDVLFKLHQNILRAQNQAINYPSDYLKRHTN